MFSGVSQGGYGKRSLQGGVGSLPQSIDYMAGSDYRKSLHILHKNLSIHKIMMEVMHAVYAKSGTQCELGTHNKEVSPFLPRQ